MAAKPKKMETSKQFAWVSIVALFTIITLSLLLITYAPLASFQTDAIVNIVQATTTFAGIAVGCYYGKAGVENVQKIRTSIDDQNFSYSNYHTEQFEETNNG